MKGRQHIRKLSVYLLLTAFAFVFLVPVAMMLFGSFKPDDQVLAQAGRLGSLFPTEFSWLNYQDVFARVPFARYLFNSAFISLSIVAGGLLVNSLAAYAFARLQWPGRDWVLLVVVALMIIPLEAIAVPLFY
ncbi:MAG: carbohydrate ABC transporter permease, partial [Thiogranum sp.]